MISNIPSHDPLDDHMNSDFYVSDDVPFSPSGTSVSSLTLLSQLPDNSTMPSLKTTPRAVISPLHSSRSHSSESKNFNEPLQIPQLKSSKSSESATARHQEFDDMRHVVHDAGLFLLSNENQAEDDDFDKAMKEISILGDVSLAVDKKQSNTIPLTEIKYHGKENETQIEELNLTPSLETSQSNIPVSRSGDEGSMNAAEKERKKKGNDVSVTTTKHLSPSTSGVDDDHPSSKDLTKRRKGFIEPIDHSYAESIEAVKRGGVYNL